MREREPNGERIAGEEIRLWATVSERATRLINSTPAAGLVVSIGLTALPDVHGWGRALLGVIPAAFGAYLVAGWWLQYLVVSDRGLEIQRWRRRSFVAWETVAAYSIVKSSGDRYSGAGWATVLTMAPGHRLPDPYPAVVSHDGSVVLQAFALRASVTRDPPEPPWRDRWGNWHGPMFEREPREAIRSVHEAYVGPWRIRVRRVDTAYQALIETTIGNARRREGEIRPTLREATDDGSRFVLDAQAALADGGDLVG